MCINCNIHDYRIIMENVHKVMGLSPKLVWSRLSIHDYHKRSAKPLYYGEYLCLAVEADLIEITDLSIFSL